MLTNRVESKINENYFERAECVFSRAGIVAIRHYLSDSELFNDFELLSDRVEDDFAEFPTPYLAVLNLFPDLGFLTNDEAEDFLINNVTYMPLENSVVIGLFDAEDYEV